MVCVHFPEAHPSETGKPNISYHMKAPICINLVWILRKLDKVKVKLLKFSRHIHVHKFLRKHPPTQSNITWVKLATFLQRLKDIISFISDFGTSEGSERDRSIFRRIFFLIIDKKKKILQGFYPKGSLFWKFLSQESICQHIKIWHFWSKSQQWWTFRISPYRPMHAIWKRAQLLVRLEPVFFFFFFF